MAGNVAHWFFTRYSAWRGNHPMSGGIRRVVVDRVDDYLPLRRQYVGYERLPLPQNRALSADENAMNNRVNPALHAGS